MKHYRKEISKRIAMLPLLGLVLIPIGGCERRPQLPDPADYRKFIIVSTELMCDKVHRCYRNIYRTMSPELQRQVSREKCRQSALEDLDVKLARQTPRMKLLSAICYEAILEAPCDSFASMAAIFPACLQLRQETDRVLKGLRSGRRAR